MPRTGHAISPVGWLNSLTQIGPLARTVDDLITLLPIIAGPDGRDPAIAPVPWRDPDQVSIADLRVAWFTDNGIRAATPETAAVVRQAIDALVEAGAEVTEALPTGIEDSLELLGGLMRGVDGGAWVRHILAEVGTEMKDTSLSRYKAVESAPSEALVAIIERWDRFRQTLLPFMTRYDAIVCPVNALTIPLFKRTLSAHNLPGLRPIFYFPATSPTVPGLQITLRITPSGYDTNTTLRLC